jgi:hypothetical protein
METRLIRSNLALTTVFTATAFLGLADTSVTRGIAVVTALVMFAIGMITMLWAYAIAVGRSRVDEIPLAGLFFLSGSVPKNRQRLFVGLELVQLAVAFTTAGLRPFTSMAFGILAPMAGLGVMGLFGAKVGKFPLRTAAAAPINKNEPRATASERKE